MSKAKRKTKQEPALPDSAPPRFCLPGHEWLLADDSRVYRRGKGEKEGDFEIIRETNGWALVRRFKPLRHPRSEAYDAEIDSESAKQAARNPKAHLLPVPSWFKTTTEEKKLLSLSKMIEKLATVAEKSPDKREAEQAAALLRWLTAQGCKSLMEVAQKRRDVVIPSAEKEKTWPMLVARNSAYDLGIKGCKQFLVELRLGEKSAVDNDEILRSGTRQSTRKRRTVEFAEKLLNCLRAEWRERDKFIGPQVPPFSNDENVLKIWLAAARDRLYEAYPQPHEIKELSQFASPVRMSEPRLIKSDAWCAIRDAMKAMAPPAEPTAAP